MSELWNEGKVGGRARVGGRTPSWAINTNTHQGDLTCSLDNYSPEWLYGLNTLGPDPWHLPWLPPNSVPVTLDIDLDRKTHGPIHCATQDGSYFFHLSFLYLKS